ncbi:MAG: hypothetical protein R6W85_01115 [Gillisia sp.]
MKKLLLLTALAFSLISCEQNKQTQNGDWIKGSEVEKWKMVEEQFGGFGVMMKEVVYRYEELYWAGKDQNWDYATHQLEEIQEAMEKGTIRRPERRETTIAFLDSALPTMHLAIQQKDTVLFSQNFERFRMECISCHIKEDHAYIRIITPTKKTSLVSFE